MGKLVHTKLKGDNKAGKVCKIVECILVYNSLKRSDAYMPQQPKHTLVHIMACRLSDAKPLSEPMLNYYQ